MTQSRILIVEDEAILALGLETRLRVLGYEVVGSAENAAEALDLAVARQPDLILMDIRLRGSDDGIHAAERIRQSVRVPVVFLSAFSDEETLRRAKVTEPFGYLIKPCQDRELRATIEMALHKHAADSQARENERQQFLDSKVESLGTLAGGIAHDFNNLLTPIVGYASILKTSVREESPSATMLDRIEVSARRASELTSRMLAYAGKARFVVESIQLNRLVREVIANPATRLSDRASIRLDLEESLPPLLGDLEQLRLMIANLATNASEALGENPGTITVRTRLDAATERESPTRRVVLEVSDTGCGMSQEVSQRVLDPFFTTKFTGRGLGLAAVQGIVRTHRGTLELQSTLGKGTTFRVILPVDRPTPVSETTVQRTSPTPERNRILIVDDEYAIRLFMERSLALSGFAVHPAEDGFAAVDYFAEHASEIDLVILDMMMPRMSGREVAERLIEYRPDVKLILMSGYSEGDVQDQFADIPLAGVLNKPFNPKHLIEMVRDCLSGQLSAVSK